MRGRIPRASVGNGGATRRRSAVGLRSAALFPGRRMESPQHTRQLHGCGRRSVTMARGGTKNLESSWLCGGYERPPIRELRQTRHPRCVGGRPYRRQPHRSSTDRRCHPPLRLHRHGEKPDDSRLEAVDGQPRTVPASGHPAGDSRPPGIPRRHGEHLPQRPDVADSHRVEGADAGTAHPVRPVTFVRTGALDSRGCANRDELRLQRTDDRMPLPPRTGALRCRATDDPVGLGANGFASRPAHRRPGLVAHKTTRKAGKY